MSIGTSIRSAIRTLITQFGNSISVYDFSAATKTENDEGDIVVTDWKTATAGKCVDGTNDNMVNILADQGVELIGDDDIIIRDDVSIDEKDRLTRNSKEYKVVSITPIIAQDVLIAQIVNIVRVTSTTNWP